MRWKKSMTTIHKEINPFSHLLKILTRTIIYKNKFIKKDNKLEPIEQLFEKEGYAKMFTSPERRLHVNQVSPRGKEMMLWIMYELEPGCDYIWINRERYMKEQKIATPNTFRAAVYQLIEADIIRDTPSKDWYWINPHYFFRGDRIKKYITNQE